MKKKAGEVWINMGCGVALLPDFINVDKYVDIKELKKGIKEKNPVYQQAWIGKNAEFVQADILALPFKDNYADYIECVDVIEHLSFYDVPQALMELHRILKPGGKLALMTNSFDNLAQLWVDHIIGKPYDAAVYFELMQIMYGNQVHEGEYHKLPINPQFMKHLLDTYGIWSYKIGIFPIGSTESPPLRSFDKQRQKKEPFYIRSDMIYVEAEKLEG